MGNHKIAIIGTGRLAALLVNRLPKNCRKVVVGTRKSQAASLADEVGGIAADNLSAVRGCQVIFVAVPGTAALQVITELVPHVDNSALIVNMSNELSTNFAAAAANPRPICAAKLIGQAREISLGSPGVIVVDYVEDHEEELLRSLLANLGHIIRAKESLVETVTEAVAEAVLRTERTLRARLTGLGLDRNATAAIIASLTPGMLRSTADPEAAPYVKEAIRRAHTVEMGAGETLRPH